MDFSMKWLHHEGGKYSTIELIISYGAIIIICGIVYYVVYKFIKRNVSKEYHVPSLMYKFLFRPALTLIIGICLYLLLLWADPYFLPAVFGILKHFGLVTLIIITGYLLSSILAFAREVSIVYYNVDNEDNLSARKARTQFKIIERILSFIIAIGTLAFILMTFESVRNLGTTILASAGVIGVIIGFAAQKSLSTLVAGIQIAITQPIRYDDVVVVEGEWGRIEELTLTYVVVACWDKRRLIVPINYFIEKPFQNWTRTTAELLATVFLYVDYAVPVDAIREELNRLLSVTKYWDKKVNVVQVTEMKADHMELRILVSAENSDRAFNLRCEIREAMINFLQNNYPDTFPKTRIDFGKELQPMTVSDAIKNGRQRDFGIKEIIA